ncbi:hypothetical protein EIP91_010021 [Steccherinum ochraceum]|uniref:Uncharacterized protein n=1 Tax=Steccherinum ochraceum TaxID=92696 RepID=A0A4R0R914_9APHY|nr:hypothetical protein EIP91_010021 [Steccherinum ochraceum]
MRFTRLFAALIALTATSAFAAPTAVTRTPQDIQAITARDNFSNVVLREIVENLEARAPPGIRPLPRPPNRPPAPAGPRAPNPVSRPLVDPVEELQL